MGSVPMFCLLADTDDSYLVLPARLGANCFGNLLTNGNPHDCDRRLSFSGGDGGSVEGEEQGPRLAGSRHRAAGRCTAGGRFSSEPSTRNCPPLNEVRYPSAWCGRKVVFSIYRADGCCKVALVLKNSLRRRVFPQGSFFRFVFSFGSGCLRACHRWLRSHVEEPHQSFQVLCHSS